MIITVSTGMKPWHNLRFRLMSKVIAFRNQPFNITNIPVVINNFNRLHCMQQLIEWLESIGMKNIHIIDNASGYPPLIAYYKSCPYKVYRLNKNVGFLALWKTVIFQRFKNQFYIYTDPDIIPTQECPKDAVEFFYLLLQKYPEVDKAGFGLKIDDLPDHYPLKEKVISWEKQFWNCEIEKNVFEASIDTTFALYRPNKKGGSELKALRTGKPYLARHATWYIHPLHLSLEDKYYHQQSKSDASWTANLKGTKTNLTY